MIYNRALLDLARHYGFQPRACRPYRPKTKGKVERPFRYIQPEPACRAGFRTAPRNERMMRFLSSEGWKEKSKPASVLIVERRAIIKAIDVAAQNRLQILVHDEPRLPRSPQSSCGRRESRAALHRTPRARRPSGWAARIRLPHSVSTPILFPSTSPAA